MRPHLARVAMPVPVTPLAARHTHRIVSVDASYRVMDHVCWRRLGWTPGKHLSASPIGRAIKLEAESDTAPLVLDTRSRLRLPIGMLRSIGWQLGSDVWLTADETTLWVRSTALLDTSGADHA